MPLEEGGRFAEVLDDATVALPLIVGAVLERLGYRLRQRVQTRQKQIELAGNNSANLAGCRRGGSQTRSYNTDAVERLRKINTAHA